MTPPFGRILADELHPPAREAVSDVRPISPAVPSDDDLERWRPIEGWPGYAISDWGRVHSYRDPGFKKRGHREIGSTARIIGGYRTRSGHRSVDLYRSQGTEKRRIPIHTLVLEAFVGPRPQGMEACHNNGNPADNRLGNLRWDTRQENLRDALRHGTHGRSVLVEADVAAICERIEAGERDTAIGRRWNVSGTAIAAIRSGRAWSYLTEGRPGWPRPSELQSATGEPIHIPDEFSKCDEEIFRPLPGWLAYRVSNFGRVQSCLMQAKGIGLGPGAMLLTDRWKDRALSRTSDGYPMFVARRNDGKVVKLRVHACVLRAFAGPAPPGFIGCHNDGDRSNNHASNLRWDTSKRNAADRQRHRAAKAPLS